MCLNIHLQPIFYFNSEERSTRKNYGIVHMKIERTLNLKQKSSVAGADDCLRGAHFITPFYSATESQEGYLYQPLLGQKYKEILLLHWLLSYQRNNPQMFGVVYSCYLKLTLL